MRVYLSVRAVRQILSFLLPAEILRMRAFCIFSEWHDVPAESRKNKIQNTVFCFLNSLLVFIYRYVISIALRCVHSRLVATQMANLSLFSKLVLGISRERGRASNTCPPYIYVWDMTVECVLKWCALSLSLSLGHTNDPYGAREW